MDPIKQHIQDLEKDLQPYPTNENWYWHPIAMGALFGAVMGVLSYTVPTLEQSQEDLAEMAIRAFSDFLDAKDLEIRKKGE
jgi:hypothetical protein